MATTYSETEWKTRKTRIDQQLIVLGWRVVPVPAEGPTDAWCTGLSAHAVEELRTGDSIEARAAEATQVAKASVEVIGRYFVETLQPAMLPLPLSWKRPRTIFVNSMSDLFHEEVPDDYVQRVFDVMARAHWHRFQVLTKRAARLAAMAPSLPWPDNVWMGVSVESAKYTSRIDALREVPAAVRFLSLEPLLGPLPGLDLRGIDWVIVGGESGPRARVMERAWVRDLRGQCESARVAFFFKQWGGTNKKRSGRELDGRTWDELPATRRRLPVVA